MKKSIHCVLLVTSGWLTVGAAPQNRPKDDVAIEAQQDIANALGNIDASLKAASEPNVLESPCEPHEPDRRSDLCAQWQAADAASASAEWAERTFWLSVIGSLVGLATLIAAWLAARYAKHAAEASKGSLRAFNEVEDGAIILDLANFEYFLDTVSFELVSYNLGRSAALVTACSFVWQKSTQFDEMLVITGPPDFQKMTRSEGETVLLKVHVSETDIEASPIFRGAIAFQTRLGGHQRIIFGFRVNKEPSVPHGTTHTRLKSPEWSQKPRKVTQ